ncbi:MAG: RNA methyltransferase, partial [Aureliella sp.]
RETLVCAVGVQDPENLGGILRSCAGLGIKRVIVGPGTADPLSRRVLRVSMGTALHLQLFRSRALADDLRWLHDSRGITSVATTLANDAEPIEKSQRHGPTVILIGNERNGLPKEILALADRRVKIDMELGTDSLNVCVAAGIIMHYYCRIC